MVLPQPSPPTVPPRRVVVVTGMSGAGRSSVLRALEDMGYETIDNLPLHLVDALITGAPRPTRPLALGIDSRTRGFDVATVLAALDRLEANPACDTRLVFVDCDDDVLVQRYTETRRRHPLAVDRPLPDGIALERRLIGPLQTRAFRRLDTTHTVPGRLKALLEGEFSLDPQADMAVFVTSFGFRHGLPREADLVFDVRFLDNPHYDPALRRLSGLDAAVGAHVEADPDWPAFFDHMTSLLGLLLPRYSREGKSYLTIAIGCTGGRHRSVYTVECLAAWLMKIGIRVHAGHRDLDR
ncbi:RNase adapter RapZ [Pararhodospirillum oryzae]|uniref:Nucleotide-binding protein n=1 Tax=Pararhodospirillum oryzae TaxID=478448 RepID=A0A512HAK3_9PROT|nr:RNase adapter RapZ [Pararhodospirillum oryzae]GEO82420.1 nucleotide-binding protein [Pararhodospirillum oryzae]